MASQKENELVQRIVGKKLSAVTFVMDYLQLQFDGPGINAYTPVTVSTAGKSYVFSAPGAPQATMEKSTVPIGGKLYVSADDQFRNRLCEQITKIVKSVVIKSGEAFLITFDDESAISISLKAADYVGAEAIDFRCNHGWMVR